MKRLTLLTLMLIPVLVSMCNIDYIYIPTASGNKEIKKPLIGGIVLRHEPRSVAFLFMTKRKEGTWKTLSTLQKFSLKYVVNTETGCWEWTGRKNGAGYGLVGKKEATGAHRVSYQLFIGELVSTKEFVCHKCDNPGCVSPFHLFKGTHEDNMKDARDKGRMPVAKHGSLTMYGYGCRCELCVEASRKNDRKRVYTPEQLAKKDEAKARYYAKNKQEQINRKRERRLLARINKYSA